MQDKKTEHYQREDNSVPLHLSEGRGHLLRLDEQTQTQCKIRASLILQHHCGRNTIAAQNNTTDTSSELIKLRRSKLATLLQQHVHMLGSQQHMTRDVNTHI